MTLGRHSQERRRAAARSPEVTRVFVCVGNVMKSQFNTTQHTHALALFINRVRIAVTSTLNCPAGSLSVSPGARRFPLRVDPSSYGCLYKMEQR